MSVGIYEPHYKDPPVYIRGIELTIAGLLVGLPLLQSDSAYFQVSGWIVVLLGLLPLVPAAFVWLCRRRGEI